MRFQVPPNSAETYWVVKQQLLGSPIFIKLAASSFWITENLSRRYDMERKFLNTSCCTHQDYSFPVGIAIAPAESFSHALLRDGRIMQFSVPITDP